NHCAERGEPLKTRTVDRRPQRAGATREFIGYLIVSLISTDIPSRKTRLIKSQQLGPSALSIGFVVDRLSILDRHVGHAPTMLRLRIDFDLSRDLGCSE